MHTRHRVSLSIGTGLLLTATSAAPASWQYCSYTSSGGTTIYSLYQKAAQSGWKFSCLPTNTTASFVPIHAEQRISCQGRSSPTPGPIYSVQAHFFKKGSTTTSFYNGWKIHDFDFVGVDEIKVSCDGTKVCAHADVPGPYTPWFMKLKKIVLKKQGGDCGKLLNEAFVP